MNVFSPATIIGLYQIRYKNVPLSLTLLEINFSLLLKIFRQIRSDLVCEFVIAPIFLIASKESSRVTISLIQTGNFFSKNSISDLEFSSLFPINASFEKSLR
jgi:hypothetical protein